MRANQLTAHVGKAINATVITLGVLTLIVGISKFIYRLPEISISDMGMSLLGVLALLLAKSGTCVKFLTNSRSNKDFERTILTIGIGISVGIAAIKLFLGDSEFYENSLDENSLVEWLTFLLLIVSAYIHGANQGVQRWQALFFISLNRIICSWHGRTKLGSNGFQLGDARPTCLNQFPRRDYITQYIWY